MINDKTGYLKLIIGPMFSGKTTELFNLVNRLNIAEKNYVLINYSEDTQKIDNKNVVKDHNNNFRECLSLKSLDQLFKEDKKIIDNNEYFLINEGHFFEDIVVNTKKLVDVYKKKVYICGLSGDFKRDDFSTISKLIPLSDDIEFKKSICNECRNNDAIFTYRTINDNKKKIIGSNIYKPLCRNCYLQKVNK